MSLVNHSLQKHVDIRDPARDPVTLFTRLYRVPRSDPGRVTGRVSKEF
jgi:hypothetical protein